MEIEDYIVAVDDEGQRFLDAAMTAGLAATVPACAGWSVSDLVRHLGAVHRWAGRIVAERLGSGGEVSIEEEEAGAPGDDQVLEWYADGHARLVDALRHGSPDDDFWRFSRHAPNSLTFWARRQAHETAIHRVDADDAGRAAGSPFPARFAADGIDELYAVFVSRRRSHTEPARTMLLAADDIDRRWHLTLGSDGVVMTTEPDVIPGGAELTVGASADALYRLLWNRIRPDSPQVRLAGDLIALDTWRSTIAIT